MSNDGSSNHLAPVLGVIVMLASTHAVAERIFLTREQTIADADLIIAGNVVGYDPVDAAQRPREPNRWTRVAASVEVTDVLKVPRRRNVDVGDVIRVIHRRPPADELDAPRDVTEHASGTLWFLLGRERGTFAILHGDSVYEDNAEFRREISFWVRSEGGLTPFFNANSGDEVTRLAGEGLDINAQDYFGDTALHWAVSNGRQDVVAALLEHGAHSDIRDRYAQNALDVALYLGSDNVVAKLREAGATAHGILIMDNALSRYDVLLSYGADVNARSYFRDTPLTLAIRELIGASSPAARDRAMAKIRWLLDHGALPSYPAGGRQPVNVAIEACEPGWRPVVELLLAAGADLNAVHSSGDPLLLAPVECRDVDTFEWLVARGADPQVMDACGFTPLFGHLPRIDVEMLRAVLAAGMPLAPGEGPESTEPYCGSRAEMVRRWWADCPGDKGCKAVAAVLEEHGIDPTLALGATH